MILFLLFFHYNHSNIMEFIHEPYQPEETIAAIATPPGEGGVAIVRISGKDALEVAAKVFSGPVRTYATHTAHFGQVINGSGEHVDDALLIPMLGKRSYTGEDTVEIHCHGGSLISRRVLDTVIKAGARPARPGEFTFRAYLNGKMDLAQAEAVQSLICAKNEHALNAAEKQLTGALSQKITHYQKLLTNIAAILEAWVDFPEEGLEFTSMEELCGDLNLILHEMKQLLGTFNDGKILNEGVSLCLIGSPNVGKSSLMNALLDKERAIVSHIPGTTRDLLEDQFRLNGLNLRLIDTAGIRHSHEEIEQEGIRRSKTALQDADLILFVLDVTAEIESEASQLLNELPRHKTILIWNKTDLVHEEPPSLPFEHSVRLSAKEKLGLDLLRDKIDKVIWADGVPERDEVYITNVRHKEALAQAVVSCEALLDGLNSNISPEFITIEMRQCLRELGKIIGTNISEDILSAIFSRFCIGK